MPSTSPGRSDRLMSCSLPGDDRPRTSSAGPAAALVGGGGRAAHLRAGVQGAPDHLRNECRFVDLPDVAGGDKLPVAQHRHAVAGRKDLAHAVRDVDAQDALRRQPAHDADQPVGLADRERTGRLVEHDDPRGVSHLPTVGTVVQCTGDLHDLPTAGRERAQRRLHVDLRGQVFEQVLGTPVHGVPVEDAHPRGQGVQAQVLGDRQVRALGQFLVHDPHAGLEGVVHRTRNQFAPVEHDPPNVGLVQTGDRLAQRALARAVLAHERVNFAGAKGHRDIAQRLRRPESLRDMFDEQKWDGNIGHERPSYRIEKTLAVRLLP